MAPTLQDFNKPATREQLRMDAFQPKSRPAPGANSDTVNNIAVYGAALATDDTIDNVYKSIANQLSFSSSSSTLDRILGMWQENDTVGMTQAVRDTITDPNISEEQKTDLMYGWMSGMNSTSLSYKAGMSAVVAEDPGENGEQESLRIRIGEKLQEVDDYAAWAQQTINALNSESDPNWAQSVNRLTESIVPFLDPADQVAFENALGMGEGGVTNAVGTLLLLGSNRERLRNAFFNMPVEERKPIIENFIKVIRSSKGSIGDTTVLRQIENLERMIVPGAYNNTDKWVDDVFSVLDATILLAPVKSAVKGVGSLFRGGKATEATNVAQTAVQPPALILEPLPRSQSLVVVPDATPAIPVPSIMSDVDNVIDSLPIEPTSADIGQLRSLITEQLDNPAGFNIDTIVDQARITDNLNSTQINDLRQNIGVIQTKRTEYINANVPVSQPTFVDIQARQVANNVQPKSLASTYRNTNVTKFKAAHQMIVNDESGQAAKLLAGVSRQDALAHNYLPEININGRVSNKVENDESLAQPLENIVKHVSKAEGTSWMGAAERALVEARTMDYFKNTIGISNRSAMASVGHLSPSINASDVGVSLKQVYGPKDGGFSNGYIAIDTVRAALAKYGIKDSDITLLTRQANGDYAPHTKGDLTNGDFLVQVDYNYRYSPKDVEFDGYDISRVWKFLRIPDIKFFNKDGGLTQQLVPKSLNIDPRAFTPGMAAADRSSGIQKQFLDSAKQFVTKFQKLKPDQQNRVDEYIRVANEQEIKFNKGGLRARGMDDDAVDAVSQWKRLQDTIYYFENQDIARGLRDRGFMLFEHRASDTKLIASPMGRSGAPTKVYDASTGGFVEMTNKQLDELYEQGGRVLKLRKPEGDIEHIISRNTPDGGWARMIRDDDAILNYRDGYYHVKYDDPYYIIKEDKDGIQRAIATSETSKDARIEAERLMATQDGSRYFYRRDRSVDPFDEHMDVATSTGRSAQKIRGKRLERVKGSSDKTLSEHHIESPIDSLTRSIASISHRVSYRNVLDAEKRRWMSQWKDLSDKPGVFPSSVTAIKEGNGANEARHAFRHIEQLEAGYGNMIDDVSKAFFSAMSETGGRLGWDWLDKLGSSGAKVDPSKVGRLTAFKLSLAANPIRQLPLQAAPAIVIVSSLGPQYWGKVTKQLGVMGAWHRGVDVTVTEKVAKYGLDMNETRQFLEDYELSGISNAVNAHSFLADDAGRIADRNILQRTQTIAGKPLRVTQAIGFDLGEQSLMSAVFAMEWNKLKKTAGKRAITATEREQLAAKVRALTGDMNRGGDMPYNSNSLSVLMQFLQAPHKIATGLIVGHRGLTTSERLRLGAGYSVAFGLPGIPIVEHFVDKMIPAENVEEREIVKGGLTNIALNKFLSTISGTDVRTDFSDSLQPVTFEPMIEFIGELVTGNFSELMGGTAAVSLIASENGRIRKFAAAVGDLFVPGSYEGVDEAKQVGITALEMFSGTSNIFKAHLIAQTGKIKTASGQSVDDDVSFWETMGKAAGFQTIDERNYWEGNMAKWETDASIEDGIEQTMDQYFAALTREGIDISELNTYTTVLKHVASTWYDNPSRQEFAVNYFKFKLRQNPQALMKLLNDNGMYDDSQLETILSRSNLPPELIEQIKELRNMGREGYGN